MFGNLPFITIFDKFILLNRGDLSAHCFYRFSTGNVSQTEMQQHIDFLMEISVKKINFGQFDEGPVF